MCVCVCVCVYVCVCVCVCVTTSTASDWNVFGFSVLTVTRAQDHHIFFLVIAVPIMPVNVLLHRVANDGVWVTPVCCCGLRFTHRVPLWVITLVLRTCFLSSVSLRRVFSLIQYVTITFIHIFDSTSTSLWKQLVYIPSHEGGDQWRHVTKQLHYLK